MIVVWPVPITKLWAILPVFLTTNFTSPFGTGFCTETVLTRFTRLPFTRTKYVTRFLTLGRTILNSFSVTGTVATGFGAVVVCVCVAVVVIVVPLVVITCVVVWI